MFKTHCATKAKEGADEAAATVRATIVEKRIIEGRGERISREVVKNGFELVVVK